MKRLPLLFATVLLVVAFTAGTLFAFSAPTIDGSLDSAEGYTQLALQDTPTGFGDNNNPDPAIANGSELDGLYATADADNLYLFISGNVESNFNKFELFIDSIGGGQNTLGNMNPNIDFDGLNRMGPNADLPGLTFDAGFEADYYFTMSNGNAPVETYLNYAEVKAGGVGSFLGGGPGTTITNADTGVMLALNNSNVGGVDGANVNSPISVTTGVEMKIPLATIGITSTARMTTSIKVMAFINGGSHDFVSNQVIPGIGGGVNLGEPRSVDFAAVAGDQFATIDVMTTPLAVGLSGVSAETSHIALLLSTLLLTALASILVLRRRN